MTTEVKLGFTGLNTAPNLLSTSGQGSLTIADNATIDERDLVRPRRGFELASAEGFPNGFRRAKGLFQFDGRLFAVLDDDTVVERTFDSGGLFGNPDGAWFPAPQTGNFTPFADGDVFEFNGTEYITSTLGLHYLEASDGLSIPRFEAAQLANGGVLLADVVADATGFQDDDTTVAYRALVERTLANDSVLQSAPTGRVLVKRDTDGLGKTRTTLTYVLSELVAEGDVVRFFRSASFANPTTPDDELQAVGSYTIQAADLTTGVVVFEDTTADGDRGATIYTASSQQGLVNQNGNIPTARTAAVYDNTTFLGNTQGTSFQNVTLTAQPADGDVIKVNGSLFTARPTPNNIPFREFQIGVNEAETARNLAFVVMRTFPTSGFNLTVNGGVLTFQRSAAGDATTFGVSAFATAFEVGEFKPFDDGANVLYFSKFQEPTAFPAPQFLRVGQGRILKVVSLREALLVFTTDGTYRISGFNPDYTIERIDNSAIMISPASAQVLNNQVYCLTVQGVAIVDSAGVQIISAPVWDRLKSLILTQRDRLAALCFGVSDEVRGRYYLGLPDADSSTAKTLLIYQANTSAWVSWDIDCTTGALIDNSLHLGAADFGNVIRQKVNYDRFDFSDHLYDIQCVDKEGFVDTDGREYAMFTVLSGIGRIVVGDILKFGPADWFKVRRLFPDDKKVVLEALLVNVDFGDTLTELHSQIFVTLKYSPIMSGTPADMKQWRRGLVYFKNGIRDTGTVTVTTDVTRAPYTHPMIGIRAIPWGTFPWGAEPWGGGGAITEAVRMRGIKGGQLFLTMRLGSIFNSYELQGVALEARSVQTMRFRKT